MSYPPFALETAEDIASFGAEFDNSLTTSCLGLKRRPPAVPVRYKEPPDIDQFARNYLKGVPYATHEDLPTTRMPVFKEKKMPTQRAKATREVIDGKLREFSTTGPTLLGNDTLLWDSEQRMQGKGNHTNKEGKTGRTAKSSQFDTNRLKMPLDFDALKKNKSK